MIAHMARRRNYELKKRAVAQEATRRRIVEAAVELHEKFGPAQTSVSAIAERAGVQRHTYYRHFPDERSLALACSGLHIERKPPPDPEPWAEIDDPVERLATGLDELYRYYAADERMLTSVTRDAELDPLVREIAKLRFGGPDDGDTRGARERLARAGTRAGRPRAAVHNVALTDTRQWPDSRAGRRHHGGCRRGSDG